MMLEMKGSNDNEFGRNGNYRLNGMVAVQQNV